MSKVFAFLRARLAERSSHVQLVVLGLVGLVAGGVITTDQIEGATATIVASLAVIGPLAGVLVTDPAKDEPIDPAKAADVLLRAANDAAAARVPGAARVAADVARVMDAAAPVLATIGKVRL